MRRLPAVLHALGLAAISAPAAALAQRGAPVDVPGASGGATLRGGQAPDGRALLVLREQTTIPANQYGATTRLSYLLTSRGTGTAFRPASLLAGSDDVAASSFAPRLPVSPGGRALLGFTTAVNRPGGSTCAEVLGELHAEFAIRTVDEAGNAGGGPSLVSADGTNGTLPSAAAGPDGRLAARRSHPPEGGSPRSHRRRSCRRRSRSPGTARFTSRTVSRAGAVTMTLKPTRRDARTLRERGRLKAALTIVSRPSTGAAATKATRAVLFKRKR